MIVPLDQESDSADVGGKGWALSALLRAGLPVPSGFCVSVEALTRLASDDLTSAIENAMARLDAPRVAVRSSVVGEDDVAASFAGIHVSRLGIRSTVEVVTALREVRASATSGAALGYRHRSGISGSPAVAAVVQTMIDADAAGVLFTQDPISGLERVVIEGSWGLGTAVVSGAVIPDRFVISDGRVVETAISEKHIAVLQGEEGTIEVEVPPSLRNVPCLNVTALGRLVGLGRKCEAVFGIPQDVEWALEREVLWILQSRAITTRRALPPDVGTRVVLD